jgi:hypothetical protein
MLDINRLLLIIPGGTLNQGLKSLMELMEELSGKM